MLKVIRNKCISALRTIIGAFALLCLGFGFMFVSFSEKPMILVGVMVVSAFVLFLVGVEDVQ